MKGMKVKCPQCARVLFETTEVYNPDSTLNGSMVKSLCTYQIDWLTASTTGISEMTCPECLAPLAVNGKLIVFEPQIKQEEEKAQEVFTEEQKEIIQDVAIKTEQLKTNVQVEPNEKLTFAGGNKTYLVPTGTTDKLLEDLFNMKPPKRDEPPQVEKSPFVCPACFKVCKNTLGLNSHMRSHKEK